MAKITIVDCGKPFAEDNKTIRDLTLAETTAVTLQATLSNILTAPKQGFGGPTGKDIFNG